MADYTADITAYLPQGPPFVLVDRLLDADEWGAHTTFRIPTEHPLVDRGCLTEAGLLENIAQTVAAGAGHASAKQGRAMEPGYIVSVKDFKVMSLPRIGEELLTEIMVIARLADIIVISGKVTCRGEAMAACEMKILTSV
jgi:predicted hotdog family 3-hydroxylacyl-ACP dehydratase